MGHKEAAMSDGQTGGPFETTVDRLVGWLTEAAPDFPVSYRLLDQTDDLAGGVIRLVAIEPVRNGTAAARRAHMACTFLLSFHGDDPVKAGEAFASVLHAAGQRPEIESLSARAALAFMKHVGGPVTNGLLLRVPLERQAEERRQIALVLHPLIADLNFTTTVTGMVRSAEGTRLPGVIVQAAGSDRRARTDGDGAFTLTLPVAGDAIALTAKRGTFEGTTTIGPGETADIRLAAGG
jgi:hypothetical protein